MEIAVIGGGNGCYAAAASLTEEGHNVRLWRRSVSDLEIIKKTGTINLTDHKGRRDVKISKLTGSIPTAMNGAQLVVLPLPCDTHPTLAPELAKYWVDGQVGFLPPGSFGGYIFAKAAKEFGAHVDLVTGPVNLQTISQINTIDVETAHEMNESILKLLKEKEYDYIFMTAAVGDYYIKDIPDSKIKSTDQTITINLQKSPDILKNISANSNAKILGFALETNNGENEALKKMKNKNLDFIALNYANEDGAGFDVNTNHVYLFSKSGNKKEFKLERKDRIAKEIIKFII